MILILKSKTKMEDGERNKTRLTLALLAKYELPSAVEGHLSDLT